MKPGTGASRLCEWADAVEAAEIRRAALEGELARAEVELETAFAALFEDYMRCPVPIRLVPGAMEKIDRIVAAWTARLDRRAARR